MTNEQMLAALGSLPDADLMTETKITDPLGAGTYYRADTVVRLLMKERERCAAVAVRWGDTHKPMETVNAYNASRKIARGIRGA